MIHIFIYHHKKDVLLELQRMVVQYFKLESHSYKVMISNSFEDSIKLIDEKTEYDIFMIDFEEFRIGMELVKKIKSNGSNKLWIFMGGTVKALRQAMLLQPSGYLPRPEEAEELLLTLKTLEEYYRREMRKDFFSFHYDGKYFRLAFEEICYFESQAKKILIHPSKQKIVYSLTGQLTVLEERLPEHFLRCHQSYLVNMKQAVLLDRSKRVIILTSGESIPISRRYYPDVRSTFYNYIEEL